MTSYKVQVMIINYYITMKMRISTSPNTLQLTEQICHTHNKEQDSERFFLMVEALK